MALLRGSRQRRHQRMEEEEYGGGYEGEGAYEGEADQYTAMQVFPLALFGNKSTWTGIRRVYVMRKKEKKETLV